MGGIFVPDSSLRADRFSVWVMNALISDSADIPASSSSPSRAKPIPEEQTPAMERIS